MGLEAVVVTADRNDKRRTDASVIVNTITPRIFDVAQTATISEGLNFCPGLRTENNCSNLLPFVRTISLNQQFSTSIFHCFIILLSPLIRLTHNLMYNLCPYYPNL